tara:strand:+ start:503 stop:811 length:309 start_codon:yes stop_codon:yes gene_type:complete
MGRQDVSNFYGGNEGTSSIVEPRLGDYNAVTLVPISTVMYFSGSKAGAGFIPQVKTTVTCSLAGGGILLGTALTAGTFYPFGIDKVETGGTGIVYVLHREQS